MIRILNSGDAEQFKNLRLETLKNDPKSWLSTFDSEKDSTLIFFANRLDYWSRFPNFGYYGSFKNNKLVAYALISPNYLVNKKHIVNLSDFCVTASERGKGVGKTLIGNIIEAVKKMSGVEQLELYVNSDNATAAKLYESMGFKKIATLPQSVKDAGRVYQDEYIYIFKI